MWRKVNDPANPDVDEDTWWRIFSADEESLPKELADWKKSTVYKVIQLKWSRGLAKQQLSDFSAVMNRADIPRIFANPCPPMKISRRTNAAATR